MDGSLQKLIRAARGPVLLMTLGVLLAVHQFSGISFDQTFPVLIIVFGLMWMLERMVPRQAVPTPPTIPVNLPPMDSDPLLYDPLREVHRNVYGDVPPRKAAASAPAVVPASVNRPFQPAVQPAGDQNDIPTAEHPVRQQQETPVIKDKDKLL